MVGRCIILTIMAVLITGRCLAGDLPPMKIVYYSQALPHSWIDDAGVMKGIFIDLLDEALERRMGIALEHEGYPWARAQKLVEENSADAFCTVPNEVRRRYTIVSSIPVVMAVRTVFAGLKNPRINEIRTITRISELKDFRVVTYIGSGFSASHPELDCQEVPGSVNALQMVVKNRADIFFELDQHGRYIARQLHLQDKIAEVSLLENPVVSFHLCIGKSSAYAAVMPEFETVMAKMYADGTYSRIVNAY